ncbi:hypothetical protein GMRT_15868 [Giardia muris]|uniref:Uncharacterized protein n=1 Tax=Giardia muris TaxID=5742 RepID=A0A4Z1SVY6_GIAMU|nr:hypothetical protein GMRT_15868 [Giardia muris]|eukprot:TNJ29916.1 hypothetical protein GMRT_15868 [Giardia muris]
MEKSTLRVARLADARLLRSVVSHGHTQPTRASLSPSEQQALSLCKQHEFIASILLAENVETLIERMVTVSGTFSELQAVLEKDFSALSELLLQMTPFQELGDVLERLLILAPTEGLFTTYVMQTHIFLVSTLRVLRVMVRHDILEQVTLAGNLKCIVTSLFPRYAELFTLYPWVTDLPPPTTVPTLEPNLMLRQALDGCGYLEMAERVHMYSTLFTLLHEGLDIFGEMLHIYLTREHLELPITLNMRILNMLEYLSFGWDASYFFFVMLTNWKGLPQDPCAPFINLYPYFLVRDGFVILLSLTTSSCSSELAETTIKVLRHILGAELMLLRRLVNGAAQPSEVSPSPANVLQASLSAFSSLLIYTLLTLRNVLLTSESLGEVFVAEGGFLLLTDTIGMGSGGLFESEVIVAALEVTVQITHAFSVDQLLAQGYISSGFVSMLATLLLRSHSESVKRLCMYIASNAVIDGCFEFFATHSLLKAILRNFRSSLPPIVAEALRFIVTLLTQARARVAPPVVLERLFELDAPRAARKLLRLLAMNSNASARKVDSKIVEFLMQVIELSMQLLPRAEDTFFTEEVAVDIEQILGMVRGVRTQECCNRVLNLVRQGLENLGI